MTADVPGAGGRQVSAAKPRASSASTSRSASRRRPPEVLSEAEAIALIKACSNPGAVGGAQPGVDRGAVALRPADL